MHSSGASLANISVLKKLIFSEILYLNMPTYLLRLLCIFCFPAFATAQNLSVDAVGNTSNNNPSTFALKEGEVLINASRITFLSNRSTFSRYSAYGVSPDLSIVGLLTQNASASSALVLNSTADTLSTFKVTNLSAQDPSIAVYPANTGAVLVRNNIANFNFYSPFGEIISNVSGSSQSKGGETISEVAMDPQWRTVVIYVPKIKRDNQLGSQAQYLSETNELKSLFFSRDRSIKALNVTENGQFVSVVTGKQGTDDQILILDRFGNELSTISSDEELSGVVLSDDAEFVTVFSQKRVLVLDAMTGERLGSTSFRSPVVQVNYFPEDKVLLSMTGRYAERTGIVNNVEFHAIDLGRRKVERKEYGSTLGFNKKIDKKFIREGRHRYRLQGANKKLQLRVSF